MIRALVVDDSPTARVLIAGILRTDPEIEIVGEAKDGEEAVRLVRELRPDLVTMDVQMPVMDGLTATRAIMERTPTPIVVISSYDPTEVRHSLNALRAGALMVLKKPAGPGSPTFDNESRQIVATAKAMARVRTLGRQRAEPAPTAPPQPAQRPARGRPSLVGLAASTGGPKALHTILGALPGDLPVPVVVVQHIAPGFVSGLASWLDDATPLSVRIAEHGERLRAGNVYLAPDDAHLGVSSDERAVLSDEDPRGPFRPSASFLFQSMAGAYGPAGLGVILTGIGDDGVAGLAELRRAGGTVFAQDERSSALWGMPQAAIQAGLADQVLSLDEMAPAIVASVRDGAEPARGTGGRG